MRLTERLKKIETSLPPKQAVLVFLEELHQLTINDFLEMLITSPLEQDPQVRIPENASRAVREGQAGKEIWPALIYVEEAAWKQAAFLVALVMRLHELALNALYQTLVPLCLLRLHVTIFGNVGSDGCPPFRSAARTLFLDAFRKLWTLRETIADISLFYFDLHPLLLPELENRVDDCIEELENLASEYNAMPAMLPSDAIDLADLRSSIDAQIPAAVKQQVDCANAKVLQMRGDRKAAWDLLQPYVLASIERLRGSAQSGQH
jgi:hypothetical protein